MKSQEKFSTSDHLWVLAHSSVVITVCVSIASMAAQVIGYVLVFALTNINVSDGLAAYYIASFLALVSGLMYGVCAGLSGERAYYPLSILNLALAALTASVPLIYEPVLSLGDIIFT